MRITQHGRVICYGERRGKAKTSTKKHCSPVRHQEFPKERGQIWRHGGGVAERWEPMEMALLASCKALDHCPVLLCTIILLNPALLLLSALLCLLLSSPTHTATLISMFCLLMTQACRVFPDTQSALELRHLGV